MVTQLVCTSLETEYQRPEVIIEKTWDPIEKKPNRWHSILLRSYERRAAAPLFSKASLFTGPVANTTSNFFERIRIPVLSNIYYNQRRPSPKNGFRGSWSAYLQRIVFRYSFTSYKTWYGFIERGSKEWPLASVLSGRLVRCNFYRTVKLITENTSFHGHMSICAFVFVCLNDAMIFTDLTEGVKKKHYNQQKSETSQAA